jgi:hypothetical protein
VPLDWAMTQNNGLALWRLDERESGTARLEEAVAAYRSVSRNKPASACRCNAPRVSAIKAFTLMHLAERTKDPAMAETAVQQNRSGT